MSQAAWIEELEAIGRKGFKVHLTILNCETPERYQVDVSVPGAKRAWRGLSTSAAEAVEQVKAMMEK